MRIAVVTLAIVALSVIGGPVSAQGQRGREQDASKYGWLSSLAEGKARAKKTGKPIVVVVRCEPCAAGRRFDGQVVRLDRLLRIADEFVLVRLTRIEDLNLNLFEFDYDLTFAAFFLDADEKVYARYGGRDGADPDNRQSLAGLAATMRSVLEMHRREKKEYAPKTPGGPKSVRDLTGGTRSRGCMHCHQIKEGINAALNREGRWERDLVWRYPLPENVGLTFDVDKANVVASVRADSPASRAGLSAGDVVRRLGVVPIHSPADVQYALDRAPKVGTLEIAWQQGKGLKTAGMKLADGWRKTDVSWRPSLRHLIPSARLYGIDLTAKEKAALGLLPTRLAFRHKENVHRQAKAAGVVAGDIILGLDGKSLETDQEGFMSHVERTYLIGDRVTVDLIRDGKRRNFPMTLGK